MADFYPTSDAQLIPWHNTFVVEANNYKVPLASVLTAGVLTQIAANRDLVTAVINYTDDAKNWGNDVVAYKEIVLRAPHGTSLPGAPVPPAAIVVPVGSVAAIEDYTRRLVAQIKAHSAYTEAIGQAMGIVGPGPGGHGTPVVVAQALTQSQVQLNLTKAGYTLLAIESRRAGGNWEQIGVAQTSTFVDQRPPLVAGQPEQREYRVQGMVNNQRDGAFSAIASVVTVP